MQGQTQIPEDRIIEYYNLAGNSSPILMYPI